MNHSLLSRIGALILFVAIIFITFWIRIQGVERIPDGQFTANDAYLYYWNAQRIAELGHLPAIDEHRWLPQGRDVSQTLAFYSYILVYAHKIIEPFFYKVSLYDVQLYAPAVCFTLGLGILALFLIRTVGFLFAFIVTVLLATLPGCVDRSAAGFSDRDAWCWLLGTLAVVSYLWKETIPLNPPDKGDKGGSTPDKDKDDVIPVNGDKGDSISITWRRLIGNWRRYIATALCGFIVFLGGLSWEGFGVFLLVILLTELWKFCTTDTEKGLLEYAIWVAMFVPWLYLASPVYQRGQFFAAHLTALVLVPPLVVLSLRGTRYLLLHFFRPIRPHARKLAGLLTLLAIAIGGFYVFFQVDTFASTALPFSENRLMQQTTELYNPSFSYWVSRYGGVFVLGSIGLVGTCFHLWKWEGLLLATALSMFSSTTFLQIPLTGLIGVTLCDALFFASLGLAVIGIGFACIRKVTTQNEYAFIGTIVWFLLWVGLSRDALRYDFFIGVPLAIGTAVILVRSITSRKLILISNKPIHPKLITVAFAIGMLVLLLFLPPAGGFAKSTIPAASTRPLVPGRGSLPQAYTWMKNKLPEDTTVIAANWGYGSQLNVFGGVKTIVDQDHFIQHWIYLYYRHVYCAQSEQEALEFLKTHNATHLMLIASDLIPGARKVSFVGSDEDFDRHFDLHELALLPTTLGTQYTLAPRRHQERFIPPTTLTSIDIVGTDAENLSVTARFKDDETIQLPYIAYVGSQQVIPQQTVDTEKGGVVLLFDSHKILRNSFFINDIGWNSLAVKLFIRGEHSDAFENVHTITPQGIDVPPEIKIWKINYPPDIKKKQKYLETNFQ